MALTWERVGAIWAATDPDAMHSSCQVPTYLAFLCIAPAPSFAARLLLSFLFCHCHFGLMYWVGVFLLAHSGTRCRHFLNRGRAVVQVNLLCGFHGLAPCHDRRRLRQGYLPAYLPVPGLPPFRY